MARIIDTQPFSILYYPHANQLRDFRHTDQLVRMINASFEKRHGSLFHVQRIADIEDLILQLGDSFTFILTSGPENESAEPIIYGMGTAHLFDDTQASSIAMELWGYKTLDDEDLTGMERWELKILCVNENFMRQGFGIYLLDLLEFEIRRRFRLALARGTGPQRLQLVLTTIKEQNGDWYQRLGYTFRFSRHVSKGELVIGRDSRQACIEEFNIWSMSKMLPTDS